MGYRIVYHGSEAKKTQAKRKRFCKKRIAIGVIVVLLGAVIAIPKVRNGMRDLLLPGDEQITLAALEGMVADLKEGEPISEALETFCREIIQGE